MVSIPRLAQAAAAAIPPSSSPTSSTVTDQSGPPAVGEVGPSYAALAAEDADGCSWPVSYAACAECGPLDDATPEERAMFEQMAADYLRRWTYGAVGLCSTSLRPCYQGCNGTPAYPSTFWGRGPYPSSGNGHSAGATGPWMPALIGGQWFNITCGSCGGPCDCGASISIRLPGPVASIEEILIDGEVLDPATYRVDNYRFLVRTDGGSWPQCQDMSLPTTDPDTWEITYQRGTPVPSGGSLAAGVLACEFAKAACGDPTCGLPQRVQTVSRQGVTVAVLDSFDDLNQGATGIWMIDSWVASITRPKRGGSVRSVDVNPNRPAWRYQTWP